MENKRNRALGFGYDAVNANVSPHCSLTILLCMQLTWDCPSIVKGMLFGARIARTSSALALFADGVPLARVSVTLYTNLVFDSK
jgi:hypothetical protein